jgi:hypothetical protein
VTVRRISRKAPFVMDHAEHIRLIRMVEGAVVDAFSQHPDYLTEKGRQAACGSVVKRVVGTLVGHAKETRKGGRFGGCNATGSYSRGGGNRSGA